MKTLLALGAGGVSLSYWKLFAGDGILIRMALGAEAKKASPEVFSALSSIITLRDNLDKQTTERMYKVFMDEPWGPNYILRLYNKLSVAIGNKKRLPLKDPAWQLDDGEKWFAGHLLTTWYLGIYYHEKRPTQRITFEHALMFDSVRDSIPIPYFENTPFGEWGNPPKSGHDQQE